MAVYLSPGVYPREIDLSLVASNAGPLRPAFIGTAQRGPINTPTFISGAESAINTFGTPFVESYLMYAVLAYMEDGDSCYIMRVGVEYSTALPTRLIDISIDNTPNRTYGWGRIPVFTGIDYGRINLRRPTVADPVVFHNASISTPIFQNATSESTSPTTEASLSVSGTYAGVLSATYVLEVTSNTDINPATNSHYKINGADYRVVDTSYDSSDPSYLVAEGTLVDGSNTGTSSSFVVQGAILSGIITVSAGRISAGDMFQFELTPNNRKFRIAVEGIAHSYDDVIGAGTYDNTADLVDALNNVLGTTGGHDFVFVAAVDESGAVVPQIRSTANGDRIQIVNGEAWSLTLGVSLYQYDIPRARVISTKTDPYDITTDNNQLVLKIVSPSSSFTITANLVAGLAQTADNIAGQLNVFGTVAGLDYYESFAINVPNSSGMVIVIATTPNNELDSLFLLANYTNIKALRFTEEVGLLYPYGGAYRGFSDERVLMPVESDDPTVPLSCVTDPTSDECAQDAAYYQSIVGWFVGTSAGTWVGKYDAVRDTYSGFTVGVQLVNTNNAATSQKYIVTVKDSSGFAVDSITDVSFDPADPRYIANIINPGSSIGGNNGNGTINWIERPSYIGDGEVRQPASFSNRQFRGMANGIPTDPADSATYLDAAVIGNPATSSGLYAFQNPEAFDIMLLAIPGFSSGAVIGSALQLCENRGDVLFLVDPPIGLRPQQAIDWHNGLLYDDLDHAINSSYGALYWSWLRIFDQFSAEERWVPPSGHVAGIFSRTAQNTEVWFAPAGLRRGRIQTALAVEYNPTQSERDLLYGSGNSVNPIVSFAQDGIVVWGQRTLQRSPTALDRVNVRMLMIYIKKNLTSILRQFIFEPNDRTLWAQVFSVVNPFLSEIASRRGLTGYKVVVDASNNTPERIDRNELWVSVFLQPTKSVEFIVLNMAVLKTGASFAAEESLAAAGLVTI
jgi:phage tail sheath protein FI